MSIIDVGKDAKYMGRTKPSDARKLDPVPPAAKLPAKASGKKSGRKLFGYTYQRRSKHDGPGRKWKTQTHWQWYATEKQRDDAMKTAGGSWRSFCDIRNVTPITRGSASRTSCE